MGMEENIAKLTLSVREFQSTQEERLQDLENSQAAEMQEIRSTMLQLASAVQAIQAEKSEVQASRQQEEERQRQEQQQQDFMAQMQSMIQASVKQAMNPSGQPRRMTTPIPLTVAASSGQPQNNELIRMQVELARIDGQIDATNDLEKACLLQDERRDLLAQMSHAQMQMQS